VNASSTQVATNEITTLTASAVVVGAYGVAWNTAITLPPGLIDRVGASMQKGRDRMALAIGDRVLPVPGATGTMTATSGRNSVSIGHLVALRPANP
jgi:hypothetical protein